MKNKREKGITLIALVITIIILLILAGIAISQLTGSGLFENARLAQQKHENAQEYEETQISKYTNEIDGYLYGNRNLKEAKVKLYDALKYSSIVNNNMTFEEMCEALSDEYPEPHIIYDNGVFEEPMTCSIGTLTTNATNFTLLDSTNDGTARCTTNNSIDFSKYKNLYITYSLTSSRNVRWDRAEFSIGDNSDSYNNMVLQNTPSVGNGYSLATNTMVIDISQVTQGKFSIFLSGDTNAETITVYKIWAQ